MTSTPHCPDCKIEMALGFIPDATVGSFQTTQWHAGEATDTRLLGLPMGTEVKPDKMSPITAYRCTDCGLVRLYAHSS
jgi:hypothetical protein